MERLTITTKNPQLSKTLMTIIRGELTNWGYVITEPNLVYEATWGDGVIEMEVKQEGEA